MGTDGVQNTQVSKEFKWGKPSQQQSSTASNPNQRTVFPNGFGRTMTAAGIDKFEDQNSSNDNSSLIDTTSEDGEITNVDGNKVTANLGARQSKTNREEAMKKINAKDFDPSKMSQEELQNLVNQYGNAFIEKDSDGQISKLYSQPTEEDYQEKSEKGKNDVDWEDSTGNENLKKLFQAYNDSKDPNTVKRYDSQGGQAFHDMVTGARKNTDQYGTVKLGADGQVTREQVQQGLAEFTQAEYANLDANGDGKLSGDEYRAHLSNFYGTSTQYGKDNATQCAENHMAAVDTNKDGQISFQELLYRNAYLDGITTNGKDDAASKAKWEELMPGTKYDGGINGRLTEFGIGVGLKRLAEKGEKGETAEQMAEKMKESGNDIFGAANIDNLQKAAQDCKVETVPRGNKQAEEAAKENDKMLEKGEKESEKAETASSGEKIDYKSTDEMPQFITDAILAEKSADEIIGMLDSRINFATSDDRQKLIKAIRDCCS